MWLAVNGIERQRADLSDLLWPVAELVAMLSRSVTLAPGDLIYTGTPAGVGPLQPGDVVSGGVAGIGQFSMTVGGVGQSTPTAAPETPFERKHYPARSPWSPARQRHRPRRGTRPAGRRLAASCWRAAVPSPCRRWRPRPKRAARLRMAVPTDVTRPSQRAGAVRHHRAQLRPAGSAVQQRRRECTGGADGRAAAGEVVQRARTPT